jgi:surface carbohydrate biosynthesis protein (TIGR04326 family)
MGAAIKMAVPGAARSAAEVQSPLRILDGDPSGCPDDAETLLWQAGAAGAGRRTIIEYLETHADTVRHRYLAWTHDLGEVQVLGRKLRNRFHAVDGASLWVQSLFFEQSAWKQASMQNMLKLIALELLLDTEQPSSVEFVSADRALSATVMRLCRRRGIPFQSRRLRASRSPNLRTFLHQLPRPLLALAALIRFARVGCALRVCRIRQAQGTPKGPRVLICGPLFNFSLNLGGGEAFNSMFWGGLPAALAENGYQVAWLHYFYAHDKVPDVHAGREAITRINGAAHDNGAHAFVEAYSGSLTIVKVAWRWLRIAAESLVVGAALSFGKDEPAIYWPLISDDWARAFRGWNCIENLFYGECFRLALGALPHQDECIFLMENQGWERALVRGWRAYRHGRITAVPHSTIRYWDLRYHCDARRYAEDYRRYLPLVDVVALNGAAAHREYLSSCATREDLVDCEALRYLHLQPNGTPAPAPRPPRQTRTILIVGDYTRPRTEAMLRLMERAHRGSSVPLEVWLKLHPSCSLTNQFSFNFSLVTAPVAQLAPRADLVFASNTTSAAVDAYVTGARVVVHDDGCGPNFSPLRDVPGVRFISTPEQLLVTLEEPSPDDSLARVAAEKFFNIDSALPRWRRYFARECRA